MKILYMVFVLHLLLCDLLFAASANMQACPQSANGPKISLLNEDFENGVLPSGWTNEYGAATYGWLFGTDLSSPYWTIPPHTTYACVNDDQCNCDMSNVNLTTPSVNITSSGTMLTFDYLSYSSSDIAEVQISVDGGISFSTLITLSGSGGAWVDDFSIDLSAYVSSTVKIRFHYSDGGGWAWGYCIDNVEISSPGTDDMSVIQISPDMGFVGDVINPVVTIRNNGTGVVSNYSVNLKIQHGAVEVYNQNMPFIGQPLAPATNLDVVFTPTFAIATAGTYYMKATVIAANDQNPANNTDSATLNAISIPPYTNFAYAVNSINKTFNTVDLNNGHMDSVSTFDVIDFPTCFEFINNILYVFRISGAVDMVYADGTTFPVGVINGMQSSPLAATYCELDGKTYVIEFNDTISSLYELDMGTLQATLIGICDTGVFIAIEATPVGAIYGVKISDNNLYTIDRLTGQITMIGNTGLELCYGQDISWNDNNSVLYGMLYDESQGGVFGTFDTFSGAFNIVSTPGDQIAVFAVNSAWTGVSEMIVHELSVYPNPADDYFLISTGYPAYITIFDLNGRQVLFTEMNEMKPVSLKSIAPGTYYVQVVSGGKISVSLIIKQ
ncbi:hypothetical protein SDC9_53426 [bioreactor metagenome]|uniref:Secretion system C-terminal sorting domain-containing protein n=1 Tax=bioreactor metagenome TaxID=1076179 RepID=A0A644WTD4_9ZZZZ